MSQDLRDISLDFTKWELFKTVEPFQVLGVAIAGLRQQCYQTTFNGTVISAGLFDFNGTQTHVAWGIKSEPHCSFHALIHAAGQGNTVVGCPEYKVLYDKGTIVGFSIDGTIFRTTVSEPYLFK